jgi:capsular polysaccharide transport system ATP-binding protein
MIILDQVTAVIGSKNILSSVSIQIPSDRRIAVLGGVSRERQLVIELLAGSTMPSAGRVIRKAEVSFPVGYLPGFSRDLTVRLNVAHVARLYGADVRRTINIVERTLDAGPAFDKPYQQLGNDLKKPLAQIVAFALPFDLYTLLDDKLRAAAKERPGNSHRQDRSAACFALFQERCRTSGMIIPTEDENFAQEHCDMALVLKEGRLRPLASVSQGFALLQQREPAQIERRRLQRIRRRDRAATRAT